MTHFSVCINYCNSCFLSFRTETLEQAFIEAIKSAAYYAGLGRTDINISIRKNCSTCDGLGKVLKKDGWNYKKCPTCKGQPKEAFQVSFPFDIEEKYQEGLAAR